MSQSLSEHRCDSDCDTKVDIRQNALYSRRISDSVYTPRRAEWVCWIAENSSATRPMLIVKRSTTTTAAAGLGLRIYNTAYRYIVTTSRNDSCMGSDDSHFNVSLIVRDLSLIHI